ncbi:MAG: MCE family protein [Bacteroidetes bacterium HGW-Bacteroidetes-21]|jgi:phospholipid/cholesterol/gamma-HCH transport system substrate-binding protein|nr:MAG: MCE family protein [Bacteroidetes bacterium HGW-Bacteroidetes-21]
MAFKIKTEVKVGVVVVLTIGAFIWGFYFLKGKDLFKSEDTYYAVYKQVDGLTESSPVLINGLKMGLVREVRFVSDTDRNIFISFAVPKGQLIPVQSVAEIYSMDLMGSKGIRLNLTDTNVYHAPGDTLISGVEKDLKEQVSAQVLPLKSKAEDLLKSIDSVMIVIQYILNDNARDNLAKTFTSIKQTIQNLERTSIMLDTLMNSEKGKISRIFSNIESISTNLRNNNEELTKVINNFSAISDSLARSDIKGTVDNANKALTDAAVILEKIKKGEGSMGMLINNDSLYKNLESASLNLDKLLRDIKENPKKYLHFSVFDFGKTVIVDEDGNKVPKRNRRSDTLSDNSIYYKLQIKSARKPITNPQKELNGVSGYEEHFIAGWYKYTIGNFSSIENVKDYHSTMQQIFPSCFIVAYRGSEQISVSEAQKKEGI